MLEYVDAVVGENRLSHEMLAACRTNSATLQNSGEGWNTEHFVRLLVYLEMQLDPFVVVREMLGDNVNMQTIIEVRLIGRDVNAGARWRWFRRRNVSWRC